MKLTDLRPKEVDFEVCGLNLIFRPFTIADDLKSQDLCGGQEKLINAFKKFDFEKISLVAWYQLTLESQKKILNTVEIFYKGTIDPNTGEEIKADLKPIDKFRHLFLGVGDQIVLLTNLIKCKGLNVPDIEDGEELKKWVDQLEKIIPSTGQ